MTAHFRLIVTLFVVLAAAVPAWAQNQNQRGQDRAVFGGGTGNAEQVLSANSNVGATYFQTISGMPQPASGVQLPDSSWFGHGSAFLGYRLGWKDLSVDAAAGAFSYYFPSQKRWLRHDLSNINAAASHAWLLSPRTQFSVRGSMGLLPGYTAAVPGQFGTEFSSADPSLILPPDVATLGGHTVNAESGAAISHNLSRRVSLDANYDFTRRVSFGRPEDFDLLQHSVFGGATFAVTRHLSVRGGYRMYDSRQGGPDAPHVRTQTADIGVDYNRGGSIRLTRKTTLSFNAGLGALTDTSKRQRYFLLGGAGLDHEIGRTWKSSFAYSRGLDFSSLVQEPVLADNVSASLSGLITPRLQFQSMAAYSRGAVGFVAAGHGFDRAAALVGLQTAITRYLALGANYTYYYRLIGDQVVTAL